MKCSNCHAELPELAKFCPGCETSVEESIKRSVEQCGDPNAVREFIEELPEDARERLGDAVHSSNTADEFVNSAMVGPCPKCHSATTGDCEDDPEIGDICIGRCFECGQLWCLECGAILEQSRPFCPCTD